MLKRVCALVAAFVLAVYAGTVFRTAGAAAAPAPIFTVDALEVSVPTYPLYDPDYDDLDGFAMTTALAVMNVKNASTLTAYYGEEPDYLWSVDLLDGPDLPLDLWGDVDWATLSLSDTSADLSDLAGKTVRLLVTLRLPESQASLPVTLHFESATLPEAAIPDEITLTPGETRTYACAFLPAEHPINRCEMLNLDVWSHDDSVLEASIDDDENVLTLKSLEPGVVLLTYEHALEDEFRTYRIRKHVLVTVLNADGSVPSPAVRLDSWDVERCRLPLDDGRENVYLADRELYLAYVMNEDLFRAVDPDAQPVWSVRQLSGPACTFDADPDGGFCCLVRLGSIPESDCDIQLECICTISQTSAACVQTVTFFEPGDLPDAVTITDVWCEEEVGDEIELECDQAVALSFGLAGRDETDISIDVESADEGLHWWGIIGGEIDELYADTPGDYRLTVRVCDTVGGMIRKTITLHVAGDEPEAALILPADLTIIEENAFAGSGARTVQIPEHCGQIRSGAFSNMPNLDYVSIPASVMFIAPDAFDGSYDPDNPSALWFDCPEGSEAWAYGLDKGFHLGAGE